MKTRQSYVSNSSSSSFILLNVPCISSMTAVDWTDMIKSLIPDYEKVEKECHGQPFCVYDLSTEREEATTKFGGFLSGWLADCALIDGKLKIRHNRCNASRWRSFCNYVEALIIAELSGKYGDDVSVWLCADSFAEIRNIRCVNFTYNDNGKMSAPQSFSEKYLKMLEDKWIELGMCDNYQVLVHPSSRIAVHFDDNAYCYLKDIGDNAKGMKTESYTYERVCEVFAKWLVKNGKAPKGFKWKDLYDATLTYNMHEG